MKKRSSHNSLKINKKTLPITVLIFSVYLVVVMISSAINSGVKNTAVGNYFEVYNHLFANKQPQKTLILFQNNAEMRYGGGFIGSVGLLNSGKDGYKLDPIRSVYYFDHRIDDRASLTPVPPEFIGFIERMHVRDSGIYLNWKDSAELAAYYYEAESGVKVDNVIAITPTTFKKLLAITGPIELKEYNMTVTEDNFLTEVQLEVESGTDKQEKKDPKTILGTLGNQVIQKILDRKLNDLGEFLPVLRDMAEQKQIVAYSRDADFQKILNQIRVTGEIGDYSGNSLLVGEGNTGANKSSPFIKQTISQHLNIDPLGKATVDVSIVREHTSDYQYLYYDPTDKGDRWLVAENINRAKILIPPGSKLINTSLTSDQLRVEQHDDRLSLNYLVVTYPKQSTTISFSYELPFQYQMGDRLGVDTLFEKQVGGFDQSIKYSVTLPSTYKLLLVSEDKIKQDNSDSSSTYSMEFTQSKNQMVSLVFEK